MNKISISDATVHVKGIKHTVKTTTSGEYWKLLMPGTYKVRARNPLNSQFTRYYKVTVPKALNGKRTSALRFDFEVWVTKNLTILWHFLCTVEKNNASCFRVYFDVNNKRMQCVINILCIFFEFVSYCQTNHYSLVFYTLKTFKPWWKHNPKLSVLKSIWFLRKESKNCKKVCF